MKHLNDWYRAYKKIINICAFAAFIIVLLLIWLVFKPVSDPVPTNIKSQLQFRVVYPSGYVIENSSWKYVSKNATLSFIADGQSYTATFTENEVPLQFQSDKAAYNRFIGSLKPSATFNTKLGAVSLASFVTAGDFTPVGQTAILNTNGTFILIHPSRQLTDDEWRKLTNSFKIVV